MRMTALWVSLLCAAASLPAAADQWSKHYTTGEAPELYVSTTDGDVTVHTASVSSVDARVITGGWKIGPGEVTVSEHQSGNRIELEVKLPSFHVELFNFRDRWVHIELTVPNRTQADIHTTDGSIKANGLRGRTRLITHDGSIDGAGFDGALEASSGDGHVHVRGRFEALNLSSGDGGIEAEVEHGSRMASGWSVHTGDGSVTVRLADDFAANIEAHTGDGHISFDVPLTTTTGMHENSLSGKLNGGGATLSIHTGDGSVHLTRL
jgi:hypothetical protein